MDGLEERKLCCVHTECDSCFQRHPTSMLNQYTDTIRGHTAHLRTVVHRDFKYLTLVNMMGHINQRLSFGL